MFPVQATFLWLVSPQNLFMGLISLHMGKEEELRKIPTHVPV
jgi:hypothetical protein